MTSPNAAIGPTYGSVPTPRTLEQSQQGDLQKENSLGAASPAQIAVTVAPADHVLTLVSSSVVNQRGFANTCGVPVGAHLDLRPSTALRLPQVERPPLRCNGCSAFLNVYCKANLLKGVWKCNMCGTVNIQKDQLGDAPDPASFPELSSEAVEYVAPLGPNQLPHPGPAHLVFAVDTTLEPRHLQAVREALVALLTGPSLDSTTLVSLITFDGCVAVHNLGTQRCSHVLPTAAPPTPAAAARGAAPSPAAAPLDLHSAVQQLLDRHCAATAARRAGPGAAQAAGPAAGFALVSELQACAAELPKVLASLRTVQSDVPVRARARCLCSAVEASLRLIAAHASLDLTRHHNLYNSRVMVLAAGPATRGPGAVPLELLDQAVPEKGRAQENRTVAAALDVGVALGDMAAKIGVAVDVFTSTATGINAKLLTAITHGSGGELMPQAAPPHHHTPHGGQQPPTPGTPPTPGQPQQQQPEQPSLQGHTAQGGSLPQERVEGGFVGGLLSRQLSAALTRRFGLEGRVDCFCSEGLRLVQWLGPLDPLQVELEGAGANASGGGGAAAVPPQPPPQQPRASGLAAGGPYRLSSLACGVVALESGRCASLRLEVTRDLDDVPSLLVQVALHFSDPASRRRVVRVVTRRMGVVESRGEFLRTVNPTAAAALLGKRAVLEAKRAGAFRDARKAEEARYAVAAQLGLVATRCGAEAQASRGLLGFGGRKNWQWPPELMPLAYALYHFQRGPLMGPPAAPPPGTHPAAAHSHLHALWDSDARLAGFNALLRAAWSDAYRTMAPKLYALLPPAPPSPGVGANAPPAQQQQLQPPQLVALPCVSLAAVMARTAPLLLDVGSAVLVSPTEEPGHGHDEDGEGLTPALLAAAVQAVAASNGGAAVTRFPVPAVVLTPGAQHGDGALAARLIPIHRDSYAEQSLQHPQLQQLGQAVAAQLSKQLLESGAASAATQAAAASAAGLPPAQAKQAVAAATSFVEWCRGVHVQPFPTSAMPAS